LVFHSAAGSGKKRREKTPKPGTKYHLSVILLFLLTCKKCLIEDVEDLEKNVQLHSCSDF